MEITNYGESNLTKEEMEEVTPIAEEFRKQNLCHLMKVPAPFSVEFLELANNVATKAFVQGWFNAKKGGSK